MSPEMELKQATRFALQVVDGSENVGLGLFTLSELLKSHAAKGGDLCEAELIGLAALLGSLHDSLAEPPCNHRESLNMLREYSQSA